MMRSRIVFFLLICIFPFIYFSCESAGETVTGNDISNMQDDLKILSVILNQAISNNLNSENFGSIFDDKEFLTKGLEKTYKGEKGGKTVVFIKPIIKINQNIAYIKIDIKSKYDNYELKDIKLTNDSYMNIYMEFKMDVTNTKKLKNGILNMNGFYSYSGKKTGVCLINISFDNFDMSFSKYNLKGYIKINGKKVNASILDNFMNTYEETKDDTIKL